MSFWIFFKLSLNYLWLFRLFITQFDFLTTNAMMEEDTKFLFLYLQVGFLFKWYIWHQFKESEDAVRGKFQGVTSGICFCCQDPPPLANSLHHTVLQTVPLAISLSAHQTLWLTYSAIIHQ